jgi:hypothetical protein
MYTPTRNSFRQVAFFTLAGVSSAELQAQGQEIVATQRNPLPELRSKAGNHLCAEFVNWPADSEGVLRFTKRFGGLTCGLKAGETFYFSVQDWQRHQKMLRARWDMISYMFEKFNLRNHGTLGLQQLHVEAGDCFFCRPNKLEYRVNSLYRFLLMEFHSIPWERLKKCRRSDCKTPYFVANHLGQRYCSDVCGYSAQREWKKSWWEKSGVAWRNKRSKKKKPKQSGKRGGG